MGKIFGISDLPVSTIMSPFEQISVVSKKFPIIQKGQMKLQKKNCLDRR